MKCHKGPKEARREPAPAQKLDRRVEAGHVTRFGFNVLSMADAKES